jgi:hypothetical protein
MFAFDLKVSRYFFWKVVVSLVVMILSVFIGKQYVNGDQTFYRSTYESISSLGLLDSFVHYSSQLSSIEIIHFLSIWLVSGYIDKDSFMAFVNATLVYLTMSLFQKMKVNLGIAIFIVLTNFYLVVMYFAAERLKFGFIFFIASMLFFREERKYLLLSLFSILAHAQMLIAYGSLITLKVFGSKLRDLSLKLYFLISLISCILLLYLYDYIYYKFSFYSSLASQKDILDLLRIVLFLLLSLWYSKNRFEVGLLFTPLILAVFIVGGDRINILGYFLFLYYGLQVRNGLNFGVLLTSLYFAIGSFNFVENIIVNGDGFSSD